MQNFISKYFKTIQNILFVPILGALFYAFAYLLDNYSSTPHKTEDLGVGGVGEALFYGLIAIISYLIGTIYWIYYTYKQRYNKLLFRLNLFGVLWFPFYNVLLILEYQIS